MPSPDSAARARLLDQTRKISLTEGWSFLILMLVAMPLKYVWGRPEFVKVFGWAHGILFIALGLWVLRCWLGKTISFQRATMVMIAALLPGGPFFMDRHLREDRNRLNPSASGPE